ncbi:MAG: alpha/beta hydrolase-fold protein [Gemmatimonadota bacterium]
MRVPVWTVAILTALVGGSAAAAAQDSISSPRMKTLSGAGTAGRVEAVEAFWREIGATGAPLVEPIEGAPKEVLVTFLWRERERIENLVVAGSALGSDPTKNRLQHLEGTDVWYKTMRLPSDLRTVYRFAVNPPAGTMGTPVHARPDPLNPKWFLYPKDPDDPASIEIKRSLLELPGAPAQPWIVKRNEVPAGSVSLERFTSQVLDNTRRVFVYTPAGYASDHAPYPLALVFDGAAYIGLVPTPTILDNLIAAGKIPPVVAVLVDNPNAETRNRELDCYPPFVDFIAHELLPWVRGKYRVTHDPARTVAAGSSGGGQASMCLGQHHPELVGNVLAQSGSFFEEPTRPIGDEWVYRHLVTGAKLPLKFYLDVGRFEPAFSVTGVRVMRDVLEAKGYPLTYQEFSGGHDYSWWRGTLADGLIALLGRPKSSSRRR